MLRLVVLAAVITNTHAQTDDGSEASAALARLTAKAKAAAAAAAAQAKEAATKAVSNVDRLHDQAELAAPSVGEKAGRHWTTVVSASNSLTDKAVSAMEQSWGSTTEMIQRMLGVTEEMLHTLFTGAANLIFCAIMLYGFKHLPADFMLIVGLLTFMVGPALVLGVLNLLGSIGFLAAFTPMLFVGVLFVLTILKSAAFQHFGVKMGLDKNLDGAVDFKDVVHVVTNSDWYLRFKLWVQSSSARSFVKLDDVEAALNKNDVTIDGLQAQIRSLEATLERICTKLDVPDAKSTLTA